MHYPTHISKDFSTRKRLKRTPARNLKGRTADRAAVGTGRTRREHQRKERDGRRVPRARFPGERCLRVCRASDRPFLRSPVDFSKPRIDWKVAASAARRRCSAVEDSTLKSIPWRCELFVPASIFPSEPALPLYNPLLPFPFLCHPNSWSLRFASILQFSEGHCNL